MSGLRRQVSLINLCRFVVIITMLVIVTACGSNKKKALKPIELEHFNQQLQLKKIWSRNIGDGLGKYYHQFLLAIDGDYLYAASADGKVYKLNKYSGKKIWKVSLDSYITSGTTVDKHHLYVALIDGNVIALDRQTGEQRWAVKLSGEIVSPASSNGKHLIVQSGNGIVYNLNPRDGEQRWQFDVSLPSLTLRGTSRAVFFANFVVVGQANGKLAVLDIDTGQLKWEPKIASAQGDTEIERIVDIDGTPIIDQNKLYAASYQGRIVAFDVQSGRDLWAENESSYRDLAQGFGNVYVTSSESAITAYDQASGDIRWVQEGLLRRKVSAPVVISSYVVVSDYKGYLHVLSQLDGSFAAREKMDASGVRSNVIVDDDRFYAMTNGGKLKAFQLGESIDR